MVKSAQVWDGVIVTKDATGALAAPSVGPAGALYVAGTVNGAAVTITGSNPYKWSVTLPALTAGQSVSMYITATIGGIATAQVVAEDVGDTSLPSDLATTIGAAGAGLSGVPWNAAWDAEVQSEAADALTAYAPATASALATAQTSLNTIAAYIDTEIQTIITNIAAVAAAVWSYATRTLTQGAASVTAAVTGTSVTVYRGTQWSITLTGLTDYTGYTAIWFGVKGNPREDTDTASICLVKTTTGLIAFDGDDTITAGHAAIAVNSTTSITITVEADATQYATPGSYSYGIKALNASGKPFMVSSGGTFNIVADEVMAIS